MFYTSTAELVKVITRVCLKNDPQHFLIHVPLFFKTSYRISHWVWLLLLWDKGRGAVEFRTDKSHYTSISQSLIFPLLASESCSWLPQCSNILFFSRKCWGQRKKEAVWDTKNGIFFLCSGFALFSSSIIWNYSTIWAGFHEASKITLKNNAALLNFMDTGLSITDSSMYPALKGNHRVSYVLT